MKKIILSALILNFFLISVVVSQVIPDQPKAPQNVEPVGAANKIFNWVYTVVFVIAAFFILIAAYYFITAGGDSEKISKARNYLLWGVVGVIIGVVAWGLVRFVQTQLGITP